MCMCVCACVRAGVRAHVHGLDCAVCVPADRRMCLVKYSSRIPDRTYWSGEGVAGPLAKDEDVGRRAFPCPYPSTPRLWKALVARGGLFGRRWALVNRVGGTCHEQRNVKNVFRLAQLSLN